MSYWPRYICVGPVRGWCGKTHKSKEGAEKCIAKDSRDVKRGNGVNSFSDRVCRPGQTSS